MTTRFPSLRRMLQSQHLQHQRVTLKPSLRRMLQSQHLQHQRVIAIAMSVPGHAPLTLRFATFAMTITGTAHCLFFAASTFSPLCA